MTTVTNLWVLSILIDRRVLSVPARLEMHGRTAVGAGCRLRSMIYRFEAISRLCWLIWLMVPITATRCTTFLDILFPRSD
ncbi:MAG UNVERIFIED_CONTAM: hypothetical protein LVR18_17190 [Planctomycetaceae bacterium]